MFSDRQHEHRSAVAACAWLVCAGLLAGQTALADPTADPAAALLDQMRAACDDGQLSGPDQPFQPIALATDDTEIALFDQTAWDCPATPGLFRHTGGGTVILRAIAPDGAQAETENQHQDPASVAVRHRLFTARGWHLVEIAGVPVLLLARHGSFCDQAGYMPCVEAVTWMDGQFLSVGPVDEAP